MPSPSGPAALPVTPERIARLRGFGLSEYAARAYLALLQLGTTEARDVSSLSKVPASKIYHILDQLAEKGLVTVLPEFPRKYAPVPFADFLQRRHDEHESMAREIREQMDALLADFAVEPATAASDRGSVTLLRARRNVRDRGLELLASAREDALVLLTPGQRREGCGWNEGIEAARARGVTVRPGSAPDAGFALVLDGKVAVLGHVLPDDGHPTEGNDTAIIVEHEGLVALVAALIEGHWASGTRGVSVESAKEAPMPREA